MNAFICNNTTINNTVAGNNASFVNACFMNVRIADLYSNPTIIDYCCFTQNVCMNNCSVVNPEISGNISFSSLKNLNSLAQNLSQSFFSVSTLNTSMHLFNLAQPFYNNSVLNLSENYWKTNASLQTVLQKLSNNIPFLILLWIVALQMLLFHPFCQHR